jgi:chorismate synthase
MELQKRIFPAVFRGISNGMDIFFRVAFKPVATIMQKQESLDNQEHYGNDRKRTS